MEAMKFVVLISTCLAFSLFPVSAQATPPQHDYIAITEIKPTPVIWKDGHVTVLNGDAYEITFNISFATSSPVNLKVCTSLDRKPNKVYWKIVNRSGIPEPDINYTNPCFFLEHVKGWIKMKLFGVTDSKVKYHLEDVAIHINRSVTVLDMSPDGEPWDQWRFEVIDEKIKEFRELLRDKDPEKFLEEEVMEEPLKLYNSTYIQARDLGTEGVIEEATNILKNLPEELPHPSKRSLFDVLFLPVTGVTLLGGLVLAFLFFRSRSRVNYVLKVMEDQIRELEGVNVRLSKLDKNLSSRLESVMERLKRVVGV